MNRCKKLVCVLCAIVLMLSFPCEAVAAGERASAYLSSISGAIVMTTGNTFEIRFPTEGRYIMDEVGVFMIQLSKSSDRSTWYREYAFYKTSYPEMMGTNTGYHTGYLTHTGVEGMYYRANIVHYGSVDGGSDRISQTTNIIYIPNGNG